MRSVPRPLALLVLANAVSMSGNVVLTVAVPWLVLSTTGSATLAATAVFVGVAGAALGGLSAGRVVDAIGAVRTGALADLVNALVVVPLPVLLVLDRLEIWHVLVLAFFGTLVDSAGSTARQTLVPAVADAHGYPRVRANALFSSAEHAGYLLGAPLGGVLIALFGVGFAASVTVAAFVTAGLLVGRLRVAAPAQTGDATSPTTYRTAGSREAIAFIWADPALRALFLFPTVAVVLVAPLVPLVLPVLARETFGNPVVLGVMVAAYGVGGLVGAAAFGVVGARVARRSLFVGVFLLVPLTLAAITFAPSVVFTVAALVVLGSAVGSLVPLMATVRQERSPAHLLPRIVGLSTASIPVTGPVGVLATGLLIDALGLQQTLLLTTALAALVGAAAWASSGPREFDGSGVVAGRVAGPVPCQTPA